MNNDGRRLHYAGFYDTAGYFDQHGIDPADVVIVAGNCQAESLRVLLEPLVTTVRIPPLHEITADEVPLLHHLISGARALVCQPVVAGYRGLALGTADLIPLLRPDAAHVAYPVIRYAGLYPAQVIVRHPGIDGPPLVPYHDVRSIAEAASLPLSPLTPEVVRAVHDESLHQLRLREDHHDTVRISDVFAKPEPAFAHTINHPGNPVLLELARRVARALQLQREPADPGRELLRSVYAPLDPVVGQAFGFTPAAERTGCWIMSNETLPAATVHSAQVAWYRENPSVIDSALARHERTFTAWGASL